MKKIINTKLVTSFLLFALFEAMLVYLAHWQYVRKGEQEQLMLQVEARLQESVQPFIAETSFQTWQRVHLSGEISSSPLKTLLAQRQGEVSGVRFLAPFILKNETGTVWVDLGFVAAEKREEAEQALAELITKTAGKELDLQGVVQHFKAPRGWLKGPVEGMYEGELMRLDANALGQTVGDAYIQLITPVVQGLDTQVAKPKDGSKNLEYMLTWSACALILLLLYVTAVYSACQNKRKS